ncbi:hypothetical protein [Niallia circulans]|uniref:Uncharacterized protein n=1 Tax=Niallia circulans TaxID=1397 RepID=A0A941GDM6_NIACI|nr:hypothetical protein [Niallia circulans]MCB5238567.1 hypothetical protein [Niallia circulans]
MPANKLSYICVAISFIGTLSFNIISTIHFLADLFGLFFFLMIVVSPIVSFIGILLGIGAIVLKEPFLKCITAIILNFVFLLMFLNGLSIIN